LIRETSFYSTQGAVILKIAYGYDVKENNDTFVALADLALEHFSLSAPPGSFLVNLLPARTGALNPAHEGDADVIPVKYIPSWFPGCKFQETAKAWNEVFERAAQGPFDFVKEGLVSLWFSFS
jgi:hypothetical protein